jgi:hypothetical protein
MGLDERFDALRRSRPVPTEVDTEAAMVAVAARGVRPDRGRRGLVLAGTIAAAIVLVVGLVVVRAGEEDGSSVIAGEGEEEAPPPDEGPARLWLSATEVPVDGADVAAVILWDGDGESPVWGVAAALDRWTGSEWAEERTFTFCPDFWGCVGSIEPVDGAAGLGISTELGESGALWVRVEGLDPGRYRIRSEANEDVVAAGQFEVVDRAVDLPPADVSGDTPGQIDESTDRLLVGDPLRPARDDAEARQPLNDPGVNVSVNGSPDLWATAEASATYQRWDDGAWADVATVEVEDTDESSRFLPLGETLERTGDYRIVIERDGEPPLIGRFWVRDRAELTGRSPTDPSPSTPPDDPSTTATSSTDPDDLTYVERPPFDTGPARLWLSATEIPEEGADVAAVILWDGEGPSPTWEVAARLDRWTGTTWDEDRLFAFCPDSMGCSGSLDPPGDIPQVDVPVIDGQSGTMWFRAVGLAPGWYRIRSNANPALSAAGQFEVVEAVDDKIPPHDHSVGPFVTVEPGLLPRRPVGSAPSSDVINVVLSDPWSDPAVTWASAAAEATIQRWEGGRWVALATVPTGAGAGSLSAASVAVGDLLDREGDLRVVIERDDGAPPLYGRFWVSDAAGPRVSVGPDDGG